MSCGVFVVLVEDALYSSYFFVVVLHFGGQGEEVDGRELCAGCRCLGEEGAGRVCWLADGGCHVLRQVGSSVGCRHLLGRDLKKAWWELSPAASSDIIY